MPPVHIYDFFVKTILDKTYKNAIFQVDVVLRNKLNYRSGPYTLKCTLFDKEKGQKLSISSPIELDANSSVTVRLEKEVDNVHKWTAEDPYLYKMTLELLNDEGCMELVPWNVGFRMLEVDGNRFLLNGVPIKIKVSIDMNIIQS